jgi:hypothetical protein
MQNVTSRISQALAEALLHDRRAAEHGREALTKYVANGLVLWRDFLI